MNAEQALDHRLRQSAIQVLHDYRASRVSLGGLIDTLDSIWNELESSTWRDDMRGHWWTLEQIYSVARDRDVGNISKKYLCEIEETLDELEVLFKS